jgi:hypothetical protein
LIVSGHSAAAGSAAALSKYAQLTSQQPTVEYVLLADPLAGFVEAHSLALVVAEYLADGERELVVNLTGGSTALQYCVICIGMALSRSRFVAVVDERSKEAQMPEPLAPGRLVSVPRPNTQQRIHAADLTIPQ